MGRLRSVTQSDFDRAIKVTKAAGIIVHEIIIEPGRYRLITTKVAEDEEPRDSIEAKDWPSVG